MKKTTRKMMSLILGLALCIAMCIPSFAVSLSEKEESHFSTTEGKTFEELSNEENAYIKYTIFNELHNRENTLSYDEFIADYQVSGCADISDYLRECMNEVDPKAFIVDSEAYEPRSGGGEWYFDSGTSLPQNASYTNYNLLSKVKKGDIIYETTGNLAAIAGHASIVEGVFWDKTRNQFYIRVIEAIGNGVCRGIFDETRLNNKSGVILRVSNESQEKKAQAVDFCIGQLGKGYSLHTPKHSSAQSSSWYCSEMVWAAYYHAGINLMNSPNSLYVMPADLFNSTKTVVVQYDTTKPSSLFTDINISWAKSSIQFMVDNGMITGVNSYTFSPYGNMTRGEMILLLYNMAGCPSAYNYSNSFSDISPSSTYYFPVKWGAEKGIVLGYADGTFKPYLHLSREQFVTFLYRYASFCGCTTSFSPSALSGFTDAYQISSYALTPMKWAVSHGLIQGTSPNTLSPQGICSRAQTVVICKRFLDNCL